MAAMYQAARQTILTVSQINLMSFNDVKGEMGLELLYDRATAKKQKDLELINEYYSCEVDIKIYFYFHSILVMCEKPVQGNSVRKKRSLSPTTGEERLTSLRLKRETETVVESEAELAMRSYGSVLRYQCGLARRFYDPELDSLYDERFMTCNWNKTWTGTETEEDQTKCRFLNMIFIRHFVVFLL